MNTMTDMAAAIVHLGRALGLCVLAQGVDNEEQLGVLTRLGCDQFQGALFSEQLAADAILPLLHTASAAPGVSGLH